METLELKVTVYQFDELSDDAKIKAKSDYIEDFVIPSGLAEEDSRYKKAVEDMDKMQTPWFLGETLFHDYSDEIEDDCMEYSYLEDGSLYTLHELEVEK